jgi:hypothetical protein
MKPEDLESVLLFLILIFAFLVAVSIFGLSVEAT